MKVAVTSQGEGLEAQVDPRFGRARCFVVVDTDTRQATTHENTQNLNAPHGAGIQAGRTIVELGVQAVLTGHVGPNALHTLQAGGVKVYVGAGGTVGEAIRRFQAGELTAPDGPTVGGHGT